MFDTRIIRRLAYDGNYQRAIELIVDIIDKKKTSEDKHLNDLLNNALNEVENLREKAERLEQENARLKEEIKNNKSAYQVELGTYNMECGNLLKENENLLQTLQEIKEIAEKTLSYVDYKSYFKRDTVSFKYEAFKTLDIILQKISEVE